MLERNNPAINVDDLMEKVHAEVAKRHLPDAWDDGARLPADALATVASIEAALAVAEEKAQVRVRWSGRLNRFPFNASPALQRISLRMLAFIFKDQRHVNGALIQALRESLTMNARLAEQVDQLRKRLNALDDQVANRR